MKMLFRDSTKKTKKSRLWNIYGYIEGRDFQRLFSYVVGNHDKYVLHTESKKELTTNLRSGHN